MQAPTRLYLLRHAEVEERYQRVFGGRIDMELSPFGHEQARALGNYLKPISLNGIYASPMKRAQQTLEKIGPHQEITPVILDELREVDFGVWTGLGWDQVKAQFDVSAFQWLDHLERGLISQAEPIPQYRERIESALKRIVNDSNGRTLGVVCHGGVIRMMLAILLDLPFAKTSCFEIDYASVTIVDLLRHKVEVQLLNFAPWRDRPKA